MSKRLTVEEFIDKANVVHNNFYSYVFSQYINAKTKVTITCSKHGNFKYAPKIYFDGINECFSKIDINGL